MRDEPHAVHFLEEQRAPFVRNYILELLHDLLRHLGGFIER